MKDVSGIPILAGDTVVVAQRQGSSTWLVLRTVIEATEDSVTLLKSGASKCRKYRGHSQMIKVITGAPVGGRIT